MSLTRTQKEQTIAETQASLGEATSAAFVAFDKLTVAEANELRDQLFVSGSRMRVVPKRLLKRILEAANQTFDPTNEEGQVAMVWGNDAVAPAKALYEFAKTHEHVRMVAGMLEGNTLTAEEITNLAKLPGRQELLGQLVSVLSGPKRGFVMVLAGVPRAAVIALQAIADKKQAE